MPQVFEVNLHYLLSLNAVLFGFLFCSCSVSRPSAYKILTTRDSRYQTFGTFNNDSDRRIATTTCNHSTTQQQHHHVNKHHVNSFNTAADSFQLSTHRIEAFWSGILHEWDSACVGIRFRIWILHRSWLLLRTQLMYRSSLVYHPVSSHIHLPIQRPISTRRRSNLDRCTRPQVLALIIRCLSIPISISLSRTALNYYGALHPRTAFHFSLAILLTISG